MDGSLSQFHEHDQTCREVQFEESRLDSRLAGPNRLFYLEVKSVTLVENAAALFPDSLTERGQRQLDMLVRAMKQGHRAVILFVIQRSDAGVFVPNVPADFGFSDEALAGLRSGVKVYAYRCRVSRHSVFLSDSMPVRFSIES